MPTIFREKGLRFFFYSSEGSEPKHVHVAKGEAEGKIWLEPECKACFLHGFNPVEERIIIKIVIENIEYFKRKWDEYFER